MSDYQIKTCPFRDPKFVGNHCRRGECALWDKDRCALLSYAVELGIIEAMLKLLAQKALPEINFDT